MIFLIDIRNKIEKFAGRHPAVSTYVLKLAAVLASLLILSSRIGYNSVLSNVLVSIGLSVACAFIPARFLSLVLAAYIVIQVFSLSSGPGIVTAAILLLLYLLYFRFRKEYIYIMVLMPVLYLIKGQLLAVLTFAAVMAAESAAAIAMGTIVFYLLRFIDLNAVILNSTSGLSESVKINMILKGTFISTDFWTAFIVALIVFALVRLLCRLDISAASSASAVAGTAGYIILQILAQLLLLAFTGSMTITYGRLWALIISSLICMVLALAAVNMLIPQNYSRAVRLQFDDDEYYYYVRAVPKASFEREPVSIKRINTRKTESGEGSVN